MEVLKNGLLFDLDWKEKHHQVYYSRREEMPHYQKPKQTNQKTKLKNVKETT